MGRLFSCSTTRGRGVGLDRVLEAVDLHGARGRDQILRVDGVDHVGGRQSLGLQGGEIDVHLDLALLAAVGIGRLRAFDGGQLGADGVRAQVDELLLVQALAGEAELQHGHAGGVVLNDERRRGARRQTAQLHLADGGDLGHGAARC